MIICYEKDWQVLVLNRSTIFVTPSLEYIMFSALSVAVGYAIIRLVVWVFTKFKKAAYQAIRKRMTVKRYFLFIAPPHESFKMGSLGLKTIVYPALSYVCEVSFKGAGNYSFGDVVPVEVVSTNEVFCSKALSFLDVCTQMRSCKPDAINCYYAGKHESDAIKLRQHILGV